MNMAENEIVHVSNLSVGFGKFFAVKDVTFSVRRGEIFGFLGANGAGKTTTIRVLCGLLPPTAGKVLVAGEDFGDGGLKLKAKTGYMSQRFTLYSDLSVEENLWFTARLRKLDPALFEKRKTELLSFIQFDRDPRTLVRDLPGGIKQQVSLAASLLHDPEIVFLDEPTAGVTPAFRALFWALIRDLAKRGRTVFVTTHYMDEAEQCDRIALMRSGELIALESPANLKASTFPKGMLELEPKGPGAKALLKKLESPEVRSAFSLLEPYGLRTHAEIQDERAWKALLPEVEREFRLATISPTLEDVFIRLVEGKDR